jgi:hypothetical protein
VLVNHRTRSPQLLRISAYPLRKNQGAILINVVLTDSFREAIQESDEQDRRKAGTAKALQSTLLHMTCLAYQSDTIQLCYI